MNTKKKKIRKIALLMIAIAFVAGIVMRFRVEPSDYSKILAKQIRQSQKLLDNAVVGNDNGEYSEYVYDSLFQTLDKVKAVAEDGNSYYEQEQQAYEQLKEESSYFVDNVNANSMSAEDVQELIDHKSVTDKTLAFSKYNKGEWKIDGSKLGDAEAINLHVEREGPYYSEMCKIMEKYQMQALILAFYHNGDFPGELELTADTSLAKGTVYLYSYDHEKQDFIYEKELESTGDSITLTVKRAGTYVIMPDTYENYIAKGEAGAEALATEFEPETEELGSTKLETESETETETDPEVLDDKPAEDMGTAPAATIPAGDNTADSNADKKSDNASDKKNTSTDKKTDTKTEKDTENKSEPETETSTTTPPASETPAADSNIVNCTIEILCTTLSSDPSKLTNQAVKDYIPTDGVILSTTQLSIPKGESVYYALRTATRNNNIQMEAEYTPLYSGNYVKGINYLYAQDAGNESGWMYKVNGQFPNYGCSGYTVAEGDAIVWVYTCDLGRDVGDNSMY